MSAKEFSSNSTLNSDKDTIVAIDNDSSVIIDDDRDVIMERKLDNFDAIMICGYGGPRRPEDVIPFMRNATKGRGIPDERLAQVGEHYQRFGGMSPINAHLASLRRSLEVELRALGVDAEVAVANRNWTPFFYDVLGDLAKQGKTRILCVFAAAYVCYSSCQQYREDIARAGKQLESLGLEVTFDKIPAFAVTNGFISANAENLNRSAQAAGVLSLTDSTDLDVPTHVCFVTHSIPTGMEEFSGHEPGCPSYVRQHLDVCEQVLARAGLSHARTAFCHSQDSGCDERSFAHASTEALTWDLSFCSRSGPPHAPWLEPDINERLEQLAQRGVKRVLVSPVGFICDHMEVLYDLDTEARATAARLGLDFHRVPTVGVDRRFVRALAELVLERDGQLSPVDLNWGRSLMPYRWPAWPTASQQSSHRSSHKASGRVESTRFTSSGNQSGRNLNDGCSPS